MSTLTKQSYNYQSFKQSRRVYNDLVNKSQEIVLAINKKLCLGFSKEQIVAQTRKEFKITNEKALSYVEATIAVAYNFDPDYTLQIIGQARLAINGTLQQIEEMLEATDDPRERSQLLIIKLKALSQLRDLAPKQIQIASIELQEEEIKRTLFDIHDIDVDEDLIEAVFD
jgi:hypothetical protein